MAASVSLPRSPAPAVRLEIRVGNGRPTLYEVGDGGFLVGSVPGCDLRLPGVNLPPVVCIVSRHAGGASLRKLAPVLPLLVNGRAVNAAYLNDGDQITLGSAEFLVAIEAPPPSESPSFEKPSLESGERLRLIEQREKELEGSRAEWHRRRAEFEGEFRRRTAQLEEVAGRLRQQESDLNAARAELERREQLFRGGNEGFLRR
jgi:hypothetical protein